MNAKEECRTAATRVAMRWFSYVILNLSFAYAAALHAGEAGPSFAQQLLEVSRLPEFRPVMKVGAFSSYDRTGGNDDGFSGKYSFIRKEGDGLVIAEVKGRGAITRIWTAAPALDSPIEFYFDGEKTPRLVLPMSDLFSGKSPPFVAPLAGHGLGGYFSYVPLEFEKSVKVVVRAPVFHFYMINYVLYEHQVPVRTFRPGDSFRPPEFSADGIKRTRSFTLDAGKTVTVFETNEPGRIQSLRLGPADAFAGKDRAVVLKVYWDNSSTPAIDVPVGDLFGYSFGRPATRSLLLGTEDEENYVRFPMPFKHAARIELVSERVQGDPINVTSEVVVSRHGMTPDEGYLHAEWRRESPTVQGRPFTYVDITGRGHMVAAILQAQGLNPGNTFFFEGDEEVTTDGEPVIHGTGSEDSFNGGWYDVPGRWYERGSLPYSGCLEYNKATARTGGYRILIGDSYSFRHQLLYTIEHGGDGNSEPADYTGTVLYYLDRAEGRPHALVDVSDRKVIDPTSFVLSFFPAPPVDAMLGVSLRTGGEQAQDQWVYFATITHDSPSGPPVANSVSESAKAVGQREFTTPLGTPQLILSVDVPQAGRYEISVDGFEGPNSAILQLLAHDDPAGEAVDFYAPERKRTGFRKLGEVDLVGGKNNLYLMLPGADARSRGESVDLITLKGTLTQ